MPTAPIADLHDDPEGLRRLEIPDPRVDLRATLYREAEAMAAYAAARGLGFPDAVQAKLGLLDTGLANRAQIPMSELAALHGALAAAIRPALPRTIEMLDWDARMSRWNWLAPVRATRRLMQAAAGFWIIFFACYIWGPVNARTISASVFELDGGYTALVLTLFYAALAGIGGTFAVLYDARQHVLEGTYDPRIGSNYAIRIALGVISGLMLAQLLSDRSLMEGSEEGVAGRFAAGVTFTVIGKPILALLGGFAAQFVYKALNKIVDALESLFEPSRAAEAALAARSARLAEAEVALAADRARAAKSIELVREVEAAAPGVARSSVVTDLLKVIVGEGSLAPNAGVAATLAPAGQALEAIDKALAVGEAVLRLLPEDELPETRARLRAVATPVAELRQAVQAGAVGDVVGVAAGLLGEVKALDPLREVAGGAVSMLKMALGGAGLATNPIGLAVAAIGIAVPLGQAAYGRWKARILDAPYFPDLLEVETLDAATVREALGIAPAFAAGLGPLADDMAALNRIGRLAVAEDDALFAELAGGFADRAAFDAALGEFRTALVGLTLVAEIPPGPLLDAGLNGPDELLRAVDAVRAEPQARGALERLSLLAGAARDPGSPLQLSTLLETFGTLRKVMA